MAPFAIRRRDGLVQIDAAHDRAFRKALLAGAPTTLRAKMFDALQELPGPGARAKSESYFGDELPDIADKIRPLLIELNKRLIETFNLHGLFDWLDATGFGNHWKMIKVFKEWSERKVKLNG